MAVFCIFVLCSFFGVVSSTQGHRFLTGLESSLAFRNVSFSHRSSRYPVYMMQLYRSFRTADSLSPVAVNTMTTQGDNPSAHSSDSVLSLMARGEKTVYVFMFFLTYSACYMLYSFSSVLHPAAALWLLHYLCYQTLPLYSPASVKMLIRL